MSENENRDINTHVADDATFVSQLKKQTSEDPERPAFIMYTKDFHRRVLTRQEVWDKSRKFAAILKRHGIAKGDIVCNTLVNSPERLITCLGTITAGAVAMHGQVFRADGEDLIRSLEESKCKVVLIDSLDQEGAWKVLEKIRYQDEKTGDTKYSGLPDLTRVVNIKCCGVKESERFIATIDDEKELFEEEDISSDDVVGIFTTSGTSGFSKLVQHTHFSFINGGIHFYVAKCFSAQNITCFNVQSMGWAGGFPYRVPVLGNTRVSIDCSAGPPSKLGSFILRIFNQEEVHDAIFTSRDLQLVLDEFNKGTKLEKRLIRIGTGGGPIHEATMEALGKLSDQVYILYGGTEFGCCSNLRVTDRSQFQDMCTGKPVSSCEVKITGVDGEDLPVGQQGQILIRNKYPFKGYLNRPEKTREAFSEDGFYKTGDLGYFDDEGQLFVLSRMSDAISRAGYIHYPGWMEKLINEIPGIERSVVIGVPDHVNHQEICLCMKLSPGVELSVDAVRGHCKRLFLTNEKSSMTPIPKFYLQFDDFICNSNGKVDRRLLTREACKRLNIRM